MVMPIRPACWASCLPCRSRVGGASYRLRPTGRHSRCSLGILVRLWIKASDRGPIRCMPVGGYRRVHSVDKQVFYGIECCLHQAGVK